MARPTRDVEIIQVLHPDDPALDWPVAAFEPPPRDPPPSPAGRSGRRRWPWAVGALVVLAVVAALVAWLADDDTAPAYADGKYLVDNRTMHSYSADIATPPANDRTFVLLAQAGPTDGWILVEAAPTSKPPVLRDAYNDLVDGQRLVRSSDDPQRLTIVVDRFPGWTITLRSSGLPDSEVLNFSRAVQIDNVGNEPQVTWGVPGSGRTVITSARTQEEAVFGTVTTRMSYLDDVGRLVTLRVADGNLARQEKVLSYLATRPAVRDGDRVIATLADTGESVVMWEEDGHVLSLSAVADRATLTALSREVRRATEEEWHTRLIFLRPDYRVGDFAGIDGERSKWFAGVQRAQRGGEPQYLWWFTLPRDPSTSVSVPVRFDPTTMPFADRIAVDGVGYVFVSMPASTGVSSATVFVGDEPGVDLTLTRVFPDVDALFGVVQVESPGAIRVFSPGVLTPQGGLMPDPLK